MSDSFGHHNHSLSCSIHLSTNPINARLDSALLIRVLSIRHPPPYLASGHSLSPALSPSLQQIVPLHDCTKSWPLYCDKFIHKIKCDLIHVSRFFWPFNVYIPGKHLSRHGAQTAVFYHQMLSSPPKLD